MEAPINQEDFESFKNRVAETFKKEGFSQALSEEIERWYAKKYAETGQYGFAIKERTHFKMQLAELYAVVEKYDDVWNILDGEWDILDGMRLDDLKKEVEDLM